MNHKRVVWVLIVLDVVVLMGQIWPEGAPPFARIVNVVFLAAALVYFIRREREIQRPVERRRR
jgi:hypothetical protein